MKVLNIGGKDYTLEYTIEASLYKDCTEKMAKYIYGIVENQQTENISGFISQLSELPNIALTVFYAGLMENHADEIKNESDAKKLVKEYFKEHKEDGTGNFHDLMQMMSECMSDDGFFRNLGLEQITEQTEQENTQKKVPQDHKKKVTKITEK